MIDISDGLSSELLHISKSSKVSVKIYEDKIPIDYSVMNKATELNLNPIFCALNGGEDYQLVLSLPKEWAEALSKEFKQAQIIGMIKEGKPNIFWDNLEEINIQQSSLFKHF